VIARTHSDVEFVVGVDVVKVSVVFACFDFLQKAHPSFPCHISQLDVVFIAPVQNPRGFAKIEGLYEDISSSRGMMLKCDRVSSRKRERR
jgi:hypothetical protein